MEAPSTFNIWAHLNTVSILKLYGIRTSTHVTERVTSYDDDDDDNNNDDARLIKTMDEKEVLIALLQKYS